MLATRRPVPPISVARRGPGAIAEWARGVRRLFGAAFELDGIDGEDGAVCGARHGRSATCAWGYWMAPPLLGRALSHLYADCARANAAAIAHS